MFHSILTHLRGNKADTATLTAALQVARLFGSHLDCLHVRPDLAALASRTSGVGLDGEAGAVLEVLEVQLLLAVDQDHQADRQPLVFGQGRLLRHRLLQRPHPLVVLGGDLGPNLGLDLIGLGDGRHLVADVGQRQQAHRRGRPAGGEGGRAGRGGHLGALAGAVAVGGLGSFKGTLVAALRSRRSL